MRKRYLIWFTGFWVLSACSRPLTDAEVEFAQDLFGSSLNTESVRVSHGLGLTPPPVVLERKRTRVVPTEKACLRTPQPRGAQPPRAFALRNGMFFSNELYSDDMILEWPERLRVPQALIFAHELTHVWQYQNRASTGYSAWRAVAESIRLADPYYSEGKEQFFKFGFEQQAAIIEDYVCFAFANPNHPRRAELRAILAPVLPIDEFDAALGR